MLEHPFYFHILQDGWICFVPEPLNHHRRHNQSVTLGAKGIYLFRELLKVQMFFLAQMPINAHRQSLIEMVRQSTYQRLSLHCGGHPDYRQHPELADVLDPPRRRNATSRKTRKSYITVPAPAHAGT